jgi:hypothetical protein
MQKKYQVFVSSTYTDLKDERQEVIRAILELGHIPLGMELFPASDDEQFSYITKVIDECDYYLLIIGGRYGSVDETGLSYTEKEYNYAYEKGLPILAFVHDDIDSIPFGRVDAAPEKAQRLKDFTSKISARRLVNLWRDRETLKSKVIISLTKAFSDAPGIGWVRANTAANEDILGQVVSLRNEIDDLKSENARLHAQLIPQVPNIAPLTNTFEIKFRFSSIRSSEPGLIRRKIDLPWDTIFATVGPAFFKPATDDNIKRLIISLLSERVPDGYSFVVHESCLATIKIQLVALGFLGIYEAEKVGGGIMEFLKLTDLGKRTLIEIMAVRAAAA